MAQHTLADRVATLERMSVKHDKQLEVVGKLIDRGMRMVLKLMTEQRKLHADVRELTNSLKRGTNGHLKRKLDIQ